LNSGGRNHTGIRWTTTLPEDPIFDTPINNPCYQFFNAPPKKQFRLFSLHSWMLTIPAVIEDPDQSGRMNLQVAFHTLRYGNSYSDAHGWNCFAAYRAYLNQTPLDALVHDANGDSTLDFATDHRNPQASTEYRFYDPEPHFVYPNGIDIGEHLMVELSFGGYQNFERFNAHIVVKTLFDFSIVPSKKYKKVFGQ